MNPQSALVAEHAADIATPESPGATPDGAPASAYGAPAPTDGDPSHIPTGRVVPPAPMNAERLEARRIVGRAKQLLITTRGMSEPEAYRWIQKSAMDRRLSMLAVANRILDGSETAEPEPAAVPEPRLGVAAGESPSPETAVEALSTAGNHLGE